MAFDSIDEIIGPLSEGEALRANHISMDQQAMSGYEEAALVRGL